MKRKKLIDKDGEVRELTKADMRQFRPAREAVPKLVAAYETGKLRVRGRPKGSRKTAVSLRLDNDVWPVFAVKAQAGRPASMPRLGHLWMLPNNRRRVTCSDHSTNY